MPSIYSLIGHAHEWAALERDLSDDSLGHAYLISGPAHIGKATVAKRFARAIMCESRGCDACTTCTQLTSEAHPDVRIVRAIDDASLSIDQARALAQWTLITPLGQHKVCIIEEIDRMSHAALQAMLKTLEEPSRGTVFIMTTMSPARLPATLVSRARHIALRLVPASELHAACMAQHLQFPVWDEIAPMIDGRPGRAIQFYEDPASVARAIEHTQLIRDLLDTYDSIDRFQIAKDMADDETSVREFLYSALMVVRHRIAQTRDPQERRRYYAFARAAVALWSSLATSANVRLGLESTMLHI